MNVILRVQEEEKEITKINKLHYCVNQFAFFNIKTLIV